MTTVYEVVYTKLVALLTGYRVFFEQAPQTDPSTNKAPAFPYVVYNIPYTEENFETENLFLEIDFWDKTTNTTTLDGLVNTVDGNGSYTNPTGLHRYMHSVSGKPRLKMYRINKLAIPDPDPYLRHRQLRDLAKWYK